jgi:hypothetical protein
MQGERRRKKNICLLCWYGIIHGNRYNKHRIEDFQMHNGAYGWQKNPWCIGEHRTEAFRAMHGIVVDAFINDRDGVCIQL